MSRNFGLYNGKVVQIGKSKIQAICQVIAADEFVANGVKFFKGETIDILEDLGDDCFIGREAIWYRISGLTPELCVINSNQITTKDTTSHFVCHVCGELRTAIDANEVSDLQCGMSRCPRCEMSDYRDWLSPSDVRKMREKLGNIQIQPHRGVFDVSHIDISCGVPLYIYLQEFIEDSVKHAKYSLIDEYYWKNEIYEMQARLEKIGVSKYQGSDMNGSYGAYKDLNCVGIEFLREAVVENKYIDIYSLVLLDSENNILTRNLLVSFMEQSYIKSLLD